MDLAEVRQHITVTIDEQPKDIRFRYESEYKWTGSLHGVSSTSEKKTLPSIQIHGYQGKAVVVVSCVTKDLPYRPHPHSLTGRDECQKGVCTLKIPPNTTTITFPNLRIECSKKNDMKSKLKIREKIRVDPFKTGFEYNYKLINSNVVRLCFQVFIEDNTSGKCTIPLVPIVSNPIYDTATIYGLVIVKLSDCVAPVDGGKKDIILICKKIMKNDIQIRFFETNSNDEVIWEGFGDFQQSHVYKQVAIWFKTPCYYTTDIVEPVKVNIQLFRPSDGATSESLPFHLLPINTGIRRKRKHDLSIFESFKEQNPNYNATPNYNQVNPIYAPMIPPQQPITNMIPTQEYNFTYVPNNNLNPVFDSGVVLPTDAWNLNIAGAPGLSLLDLDSNQLQLVPNNQNAENLPELNNLSDELSINLSLNDFDNIINL